MRPLRPCVLALSLVLAGAPLGAAQDYDTPGDAAPEVGDDTPEPGDDPPDVGDSAPDPGDYQDALAPYGTWNDTDAYGRIWQPAVAVGWQPYVQGHWAWTPYGWTWISYEPWGWTFHYGRWMLLPAGWYWVPGTVWGPAWVDWYWGDGFVGWAPLSPFATHVTVINHFVFVHVAHFC